MDSSIPHHVYKSQCSKCERWLPFNRFPTNSKHPGKVDSWCRDCRNKQRRDNTTPEMWRKQNLRRFGMTPQQYDRMLEEQGGVCRVCKQPETRKRPWSKNGEINPLAVDHDHKTGEPRALLCSHCNTSLGKLDEDPERIRALADYAEWCQSRKPNVKIIQLSLMLEQPDIDRGDNAV